MYRSSDLGQTWKGPTLINKATRKWDFASCNIIELDDGRLLMTMQRRLRGSNLGGDFYIDVVYSSDGGETWSDPEEIFQGANWEGRPMQVPNDANGDGTDDIYLFFTQRIIETTLAPRKATRRGDNGRGVAYIASYDGGETWSDPNPERYTGKSSTAALTCARDWPTRKTVAAPVACRSPSFCPTTASGSSSKRLTQASPLSSPTIRATGIGRAGFSRPLDQCRLRGQR